MASTTFSGAVTSTNGFVGDVTGDVTGNVTGNVTGDVTGNVTGNVTGDVQGAALTTTQGSGMAGLTAYSSEITKVGKVITTHIYIDIEGLVNSTTAGDIIGDSAAANCHLGQILVAECGQVFSGSMSCLEAPTGGDPDIDLYAAVESTGTENAAISGLTSTVVLVAGGGSWTLGQSQALTGDPDGTSDYLYLTVGSAGGAPGTYTAGKFLIEFIGYEA
jgi:hypothetical protein